MMNAIAQLRFFKLGFTLLFLATICVPGPVLSEDALKKEKDPFAVSEEDMFSEQESVHKVDQFKDENITDKFDKGSVGVSGELQGSAIYSSATDEAKADTSVYGQDDAYSATIEGDILFDARWKYGLKFFTDIYVTYTPLEETGREESLTDEEADEEDYDIIVREVFGDVNILRKIFFRIGKQNLKWGRGYFWNPTDLISTSRKDFNDVDARREGTYGMKTQIPFGTKLNLYSFIDTTDAEKSEDTAFAGKVEFIIFDNTEVSFSGWNKAEYEPVYGFDFSTNVFDTQWRGEVSYTKGGNQHYLVEKNGQWVDDYDADETIIKTSFGFTKRFDVGDVNDRLGLTGEFLVNPKGYEENMLERRPLTLPNGMVIQGMTLRELFLSQYYEPYYYGKYYAAFFVSYSHLLNTSDLSASLNSIANVSDGSSITTVNLNYEMTFDTRLSASVTSYNGAEAREFTLTGIKNSVEISFVSEF